MSESAGEIGVDVADEPDKTSYEVVTNFRGVLCGAEPKTETIKEGDPTHIHVEQPKTLSQLELKEANVRSAFSLLRGYLLTTFPGDPNETPDWVFELWRALGNLNDIALEGLYHIKKCSK